MGFYQPPLISRAFCLRRPAVTLQTILAIRGRAVPSEAWLIVKTTGKQERSAIHENTEWMEHVGRPFRAVRGKTVCRVKKNIFKVILTASTTSEHQNPCWGKSRIILFDSSDISYLHKSSKNNVEINFSFIPHFKTVIYFLQNDLFYPFRVTYNVVEHKDVGYYHLLYLLAAIGSLLGKN